MKKSDSDHFQYAICVLLDYAQALSDVPHFIENAVHQKQSHAHTLILTQTKCGLKISLGDYHFTE